MNIIFKTVFGSHLYGTDTEFSDRDFKGIYVPTLAECVLGKQAGVVSEKRKKLPGEKNTSDDIDTEFFSLQKFIKLACEGQTVAIDMLHSHPSKWSIARDAWELLHDRRREFYSRNMDAFIGYAMRQAAKYGVKGSRLACAKAWLAILENNPSMHMGEILNIGLGRTSDATLWEHATQYPDKDNPDVCLEIVGRRYTTTAKAGHYISSLALYVSEYGERARLAEVNLGIDWKAMSHAVRAAIEVETIMRGDELVLPFDDDTATMLRRIKMGLLPFADVMRDLERRIERVKGLAEMRTDLPERVDPAGFDRFITGVVYGLV